MRNIRNIYILSIITLSFEIPNATEAQDLHRVQRLGWDRTPHPKVEGFRLAEDMSNPSFHLLNVPLPDGIQIGGSSRLRSPFELDKRSKESIGSRRRIELS
ncbi:hypothetical protein DFH28DRAFT_986115 [Melampsora americana]|nr:hypothetical protein DFH28DRAFT_986115 [Melampsora americana]